ncbi:hypothetical protein FRC05_008313 [Tulasnella sp. 425]|nr:hypothetical protein FRC05_008313 [Tulasnella sp. 425]
MDHGLRCSPQMKLPEAPEDKSVPLKVPTVGTELTLKNVLSYPVVYRLRFKARPGAQPSTSRSSKRGKHSIDPREDATGFLPSKASRSVRVVRDGGGKKPDVPSGPDGSLEVLWCISATSEGADMTEERKKQILNEAKSKSELKMVRMSIDAILSSPAPRRTALLQPSQTQAPYVDPSRWKHGEWVSFTLTNPTDGNQYPAQFAHVAWNSNDRGGYGEVWKCRIDVQGADQPSSFVAVKSLVLLNETRPPNGETITEPLKELTEGLQYLHSNNVIHGDIHNVG